MRRPDFFIVGAPKCGTTALYSYLRQHPDIFMPLVKEPHYFGTDLRRSHPVDLETYLSYFAEAGDRTRVGEASTSYLYSQRAAEEIKSFNPAATIIVMLRNPVDMIYSLHGQRLYQGSEDVRDFATAIASEERRRLELGLPDPPDTSEGPIYRPIARFAAQVERYFDVFGRERVRVILQDDLRADVAAVYRDTLRFLDVNEDFEPEFRPVNERKSARSRTVTSLLRRPPPAVQRVAGRLMSKPTRERLYGRIRALNTKPESSSPIEPALRKRLEAEFADELGRLSELLGRDLSGWTRKSSTEANLVPAE